MPVEVADKVMVLDVGGTRRARTGVRPDDASDAKWRLDLLGLEEPVQDLRDALLGQGLPVLLALRTVEGAFDVVGGRGGAREEGTHAGDDAVPHLPVGVVGCYVIVG